MRVRGSQGPLFCLPQAPKPEWGWKKRDYPLNLSTLFSAFAKTVLGNSYKACVTTLLLLPLKVSQLDSPPSSCILRTEVFHLTWSHHASRGCRLPRFLCLRFRLIVLCLPSARLARSPEICPWDTGLSDLRKCWHIEIFNQSSSTLCFLFFLTFYIPPFLFLFFLSNDTKLTGIRYNKQNIYLKSCDIWDIWL